MSSLAALPVCVFCTFVNPPESKICVICKKSLHIPAVPASNVSEIKVCPECSFYNEKMYNICQVCGAGLMAQSLLKQETGGNSSKIRICSDCSYQNDPGNVACQMCGKYLPNAPTLEQHTDAIHVSADVCSMCGTGLQIPGNQFKVCTTCTYHNLPDAVKCLICRSKFGSVQKEALNKVCLFCNYINAPGVACTQCTFINSIGTLACIICESPLQALQSSNDSTDSEIDTMDEDAEDTEMDVASIPDGSSSDEYYEDDYTDNDSIDVDENEDAAPTSTNAPTSGTTPTVDENIPKYEVSSDSFEMLESAPETHKYFKVQAETHSAKFLRAVTTNIEILKTSVPPGVWIKVYEDRLDLLTFMIEGPTQTPYENGLFVFDICLPHNFPSRPPKAHYISFWHNTLNPNLYVDGKVCVSLLGTWIAHRKEEKWGPKSTLLQLIVSIQGLILVEQPYFNEPGYEGQHGTDVGKKRSAAYNERVIIGMIDSTTALIANPPVVFKKEIFLHFSKCGQKMYKRLKASVSSMRKPDYQNLEKFRKAIENICNTATSN